MSTQQKYLKDKNGEIFSPIVGINSIYNQDGESLENFLYYKSGDVITFGDSSQSGAYIVTGFVSGSTKTIFFSLRTDKSLKNISNITIQKMNLNIRKSEGGYINPDGGGYVSGGYNFLSGFSHSVFIIGQYDIHLRIISDTAFDVKNNTPLSFEVNNITLKLA